MECNDGICEREDDESSDEIDAPNALIRFYTTVFECADTILLICQNEEKLNPNRYEKTKISPFIAMFKTLLSLFSKERLAQHYCKFVLPYRSNISIDDFDDLSDNDKLQFEITRRKFFLENDNLYPGAPAENIKFFKDLWIDMICGECLKVHYGKRSTEKSKCEHCKKVTEKRYNKNFHFSLEEQDIIIEYFDTMLYYCDIWKELTNYQVSK